MIQFSLAGFMSRVFSQTPLTWGAWQGHRSVGLTLSKVKKVKLLVDQLYLTFFNPKDCSPPGSSIHEILQVRILEWVADSTLFTPVPNVYAWTFRFSTKSLFCEISRMLPTPAYHPAATRHTSPDPSLQCCLAGRRTQWGWAPFIWGLLWKARRLRPGKAPWKQMGSPAWQQLALSGNYSDPLIQACVSLGTLAPSHSWALRGAGPSTGAQQAGHSDELWVSAKHQCLESAKGEILWVSSLLFFFHLFLLVGG